MHVQKRGQGWKYVKRLSFPELLIVRHESLILVLLNKLISLSTLKNTFKKSLIGNIESMKQRNESQSDKIIFIEDFLGGRQQRVLYNDCFSNWGMITSEVPQESVIGPFLFAIVMDSLVPVCNNSVMIEYADDVAI